MPLPGEPLWLPDDTEKSLAFELAQREACPRCGTREADWIGPDGPLTPPPLEPVVKHCFGCAEKTHAELDLAEEVRGEAQAAQNPDSVAARLMAGKYVAWAPFDVDADEED